jgi:hypothetical protein
MNDPSEGICVLQHPGGPIVPGASQADIYAYGNYAWGMQIRHDHSRSELRLASFSAVKTNPLLWAHYADAHRGICIGFNTVAASEISRAVPVQYSLSPPIWRGNDRHLLASVFCTKNSDWAYEEEWRIFGEGSEFVPLPTGAISQVILGAKILPQDEGWVRDWVRIHGGAIRIERAVFDTDRYAMRTVAAQQDSD